MKRLLEFPAFMPADSSESGIAPSSEVRVRMDYAMPARLEAWLRLAECGRLLGPLISIQTALVLSGFQARVFFRARAGSVREPSQEVAIHAVLVPSGERLARPRQPVRGISRRSLLTLQLFDRQGQPLTPRREIGRCVDGIHELEVPFSLDTNAEAWVTARPWSERRRPRISLSGELVFTRGVTVRLGFRPPDRQEEDEGQGATDLPLVHPGAAFHFPEKTCEGGPSGNSWVSVLFLDEHGQPIDSEHCIGRCVLL